jgi:catechol 2,3-dioxygenase-like lactoylglutathione lyase family enzyme
MQVEALDHVNIITVDVDRAAAFYAEIVGLEARDGPPPLTHATARWMHDAGGRAVVHINSFEAPRAFPRDIRPGPTGALHHVALRCVGHDGMAARLEERGIDHRSNTVASIGLRQIFVADPDGVLLELNFFGD